MNSDGSYTIESGKNIGEIRYTEAGYAALPAEEQEAYDDYMSEADLRWAENGGALEAANDYWAWQVAQREPAEA